MLRDPVSLGIAVALPLLMLLTLQALGGDDAPFLTLTLLTPGIVLFGFVMVMFSSAMILSPDRETSLLARLLTTPLRSSDFVAGYSLPYLFVAIVQANALISVGVLLSLEVGNEVRLSIWGVNDLRFDALTGVVVLNSSPAEVVGRLCESKPGCTGP